MGVSKTSKPYSDRYKTDVSVSQTTNTGFDATTRKLCSGDGADSSMSASDDVKMRMKPNKPAFKFPSPSGEMMIHVFLRKMAPPAKKHTMAFNYQLEEK